MPQNILRRHSFGDQGSNSPESIAAPRYPALAAIATLPFAAYAAYLSRFNDWKANHPITQYGDVAMLIAQTIADHSTTIVTQTGLGLGSVIAVVCSWHRNRSILWAILAGILSWFYVVYFAFTRQPEEMK